MVFHFSILFWNEQFSDWLDQHRHSILLLLYHEHEPIPQRNQRWSVSLSLFPWMWIDMDKHQTEFHFLKPPLDSSHLHLDQKHIGKESEQKKHSRFDKSEWHWIDWKGTAHYKRTHQSHRREWFWSDDDENKSNELYFLITMNNQTMKSISWPWELFQNQKSILNNVFEFRIER